MAVTSRCQKKQKNKKTNRLRDIVRDKHLERKAKQHNYSRGTREHTSRHTRT